MIQPHEIRKGNWVKEGNEYFQTTEYTPIKIVNGEKEYEPIKLTAEILGKIDQNNQPQPARRILYNLYLHYCVGRSCAEIENYKVEIKYVHQLQNLYFVLTGEELDITP